MAPAKASGQKKAKSANGYRLPDPIPAGEIVTGLTKKKSWRVGKSIGKQEQFQELLSKCASTMGVILCIFYAMIGDKC